MYAKSQIPTHRHSETITSLIVSKFWWPHNMYLRIPLIRIFLISIISSDYESGWNLKKMFLDIKWLINTPREPIGLKTFILIDWIDFFWFATKQKTWLLGQVLKLSFEHMTWNSDTHAPCKFIPDIVMQQSHANFNHQNIIHPCDYV